MPKNKFDYAKMKAEFFASEELNLNTWLKHTYQLDTSKMSWKDNGFKWRKKEKFKYLERLKDAALKQWEKDYVKRYKPDVAFLDKMHNNTMMILWKLQMDIGNIKTKDADWLAKTDLELRKLEQMTRIIDRATSSIWKMWEIIKTEKGEPTKINKNFNNNTEITPLTEEELEQIKKLNDLNE